MVLAAAVAADSAVEAHLEAGKKIPQHLMWSRALLTEDEFQRISDEIKAVEMKTSGEIVPMVVRRSTSVGHVPFIVGLILLSIFLIIDLNWFLEADLWLRGASWVLEVVIILVCMRFLAPLHFVERLLTDREDMRREVEMRAQLEFYQNGLEKTSGSTGILIFVSLMEHQVVILADKNISQKIDPKIWDDLLSDLIGAIRRGEFADGVIRVIRKIGDIIVPHFPVASGDKNELANELIIKD